MHIPELDVDRIDTSVLGPAAVLSAQKERGIGELSV